MAAIPISMSASPTATLSGSAQQRKSFDSRSVVEFFLRTRAYDVMPENSKVAVADQDLSLEDLLQILAEHKLGACVLWGEDRCRGVITPAALCALLIRLVGNSTPEELEGKIRETTLSQAVSELELSLETEAVSPDATVLEVLQQMRGRVELLQVCEPGVECPVFLVNYPRILRYVMSHFQDAEGDTLLEQSISSLIASQPQQVEPAQGSLTVLEAFSRVVAEQLAYLPVLDEHGVLLALLTPEDIVSVAASPQRWAWLSRPLSEWLDSPNWLDSLQSCLPTEALEDVLRRLAQSGCSRMGLVELDGSLRGVVLLESLFHHFLESPGAEPEEMGGEEPDPEDDSVTMQFGRFAVTDFEDDDE